MTLVIPPVVGPDLLADLPRVVLADVRWYLDGRDGHAAFAEGHLPGAVWVDLDRHLAAHGLAATEGRHPLPTPEAFAASMGSLGVADDSVVIAYDDTGGLTAGRLVTMLRWLGREAAVLDGGLGAWVAEGRPVATGPSPDRSPAVFTAAPWPVDRLVGADELPGLVAGGGVLLDARAAERFRGEVAMVDPRPGHVPRARNAPWSAVLGPDGRFRPVHELRAHYDALGAAGDAPVAAYCGSGVSACMNLVAMELAGLQPPRLYVASWSGWSSDPDRPAELGPST